MKLPFTTSSPLSETPHAKANKEKKVSRRHNPVVKCRVAKSTVLKMIRSVAGGVCVPAALGNRRPAGRLMRQRQGGYFFRHFVVQLLVVGIREDQHHHDLPQRAHCESEILKNRQRSHRGSTKTHNFSTSTGVTGAALNFSDSNFVTKSGLRAEKPEPCRPSTEGGSIKLRFFQSIKQRNC